MKKLILLIAFTTACSTSTKADKFDNKPFRSLEQPFFSVPDSSYTYMADGTLCEKQYYFVDHYGNYVGYEIYQKDNENWILNQKYECSFNANTDVTSETSYQWKDNALTKDSYSVDIYDADGNWIQQINYKWENGEQVYYSKSDFTYDGKGNETSYTKAMWIGGNWMNSYQEVYTLDNGGNRIKIETFSYDNND